LNLPDWDDRYRSQSELSAPTPLVVETARRLPRGRVLDLACGTGRNALWLASNGWSVTAVDGSAAAIEKLRLHAGTLPMETHIADLEKGEFAIAESSWDLILACYYLQRDLFVLPKGVNRLPNIGCVPENSRGIFTTGRFFTATRARPAIRRIAGRPPKSWRGEADIVNKT
jgi:SAM-dependent methyltransferase